MPFSPSSPQINLEDFKLCGGSELAPLLFHMKVEYLSLDVGSESPTYFHVMIKILVDEGPRATPEPAREIPLLFRGSLGGSLGGPLIDNYFDHVPLQLRFLQHLLQHHFS
jgi:hypothetical protein